MSTIEVLNTAVGRTAKYIGTYDMWFPHGDVNKPYTRAWWIHTMLLNGLNHTALMSFRPLDTEFFFGMNGASTSGGNDNLPYGNGVTDKASFDDRRNTVLTAADPLNNAYIDGTKFGWHSKPANSATMPWAEVDGDCGKWSDWPDRTMSNYGSIDPDHRMTYTASLGNLDYLRSLPTQTWADKWETWEHTFANTYYLAKNWPNYFNGRVLFWNSTNTNDIDVSGTDIYSSGIALMRDAVEQAMSRAGKSSSDVSVTFGHDNYDLSLADSASALFYDRGVNHTYDMSPMGDLRTAAGTPSKHVYLAYNEFSSTHVTAGQGVVNSMTESEGKDLLRLINRFNLAGEGLEEYDQYIPWHPMAEKNYTLSTPINKDGNIIFGNAFGDYVWTDDYYNNPPTFQANPGMYYFIMGLRAAGRGGTYKEVLATFGGSNYTTLATRDSRLLYVTMASDFSDTVDLQFDPSLGLNGKTYDIYRKDASHNDVVVASDTLSNNQISGLLLPSPGAVQVVIDHGGSAVATPTYDEDFSSFDSTRYWVSSGSPSVTVTNGVLDMLGTGSIQLKRASSSNVVVETEFQVQMDTNNDAVLITFGYWNGKMNMAGLDQNSWVISDKLGPGRNPPQPAGIVRGQKYKMKIELTGQECRLSVDDGSGYTERLHALLLANDASPLGLGVNNSHVQFSRFTVTYNGAVQTTGYSLLGITPYEFDLGSISAPASRSFTVQNVGPGTMNYSIVALDSFVSVDVSSGSTSGQKNTITLTVDPSSLPLGLSTGRIRIAEDRGGNNFQVLPVRFQVKAGVPVAAVTASSELSGYPASNAVDGDTSSRWSATDNSYPQWLKLDLGVVTTINKVRTIFYQFSSRTYSYEIQTSVDDASYATVVASKNSSQTVEWNEDSFPASSVRFVRVNIAGCSDPAGYAQITEIEVLQTGVPVAAVTASSELSDYPATNAVDGDTSSRWSATDNSYPQWLKLDLGVVTTINKVRTIFYQFSSRTYSYKIETSVDDASYATAVASKNSSQTVEWNEDSFPASNVRFIRVNIAGCSDPAGYAQITEIEVLKTGVPVAAVTASSALSDYPE